MGNFFLFISKLVPIFVYPVGLISILVLLALVLRNESVKKAILVGILVILLLGGNRWMATALGRSLEWRYPPLDEPPKAEVIVVLGGGTLPVDYPRQTVEVSSAGDRVLYAAQLYQQNVADVILLTGGRLDWSASPSSPAEDMAELLISLGIPEESLWLETESRNTYENALFSSRLLSERNIKSILLVTSAMHMRRAVMLFESMGLEVIPLPTDFTITQSESDGLNSSNLQSIILSLLPSVENLALTTQVIKEYLGILVYTIRG